MTLPLTFNSRCSKLGHTFSAAKYYARNFLYLRHCKRCPEVITGTVQIKDAHTLDVQLKEHLNAFGRKVVDSSERSSSDSVSGSERAGTRQSNVSSMNSQPDSVETKESTDEFKV